jgi:hypothetical protein
MLPRLAAVLSLVLVHASTVGCGPTAQHAPGHVTSRSRTHNLVVFNPTTDDVKVYVGLTPTVGDNPIFIETSSVENVKVAPVGTLSAHNEGFYYILPGPRDVTLVGKKGGVRTTVTFSDRTVAVLRY